MYYAYSPDTDYENDRTVARSDDALTLDQLHHEAYGKGSGGQPGARRKKRQAFGNIGNQSRLVSEVQVRKRFGTCHDLKRATNSFTVATPTSGGTVASTDASTALFLFIGLHGGLPGCLNPHASWSEPRAKNIWMQVRLCGRLGC